MGADWKSNYAALQDLEHSENETGPTSKSATFKGFSIYKWTALVAFISAALGASVLCLGQFLTTELKNTWGGAGRRLENLLSFPLETVKFEPDTIFASPSTPESDEAWMGLLGPTRGFISLKYPSQYGLGLGQPVEDEPNSEVYGLSLFHQLHCLIMIRDVYYGLLQRRDDISEYESNGTSKIAHKIKHIAHCFDYLQQAIRCAGLMQVELPNGGNRSIFDGYGSEHTCKSWSSVTDFMYTYRMNAPKQPEEV